jgi:hypothetical protein
MPKNCFIKRFCFPNSIKISLDRLLRLNKVDVPWISRQPGQLAQEGGKVVSLMHWPPLAPRT